MSLSEDGRKDLEKKLRQEGLQSVRLKLSQGDYSKEGNRIQSFIRAWIENEKEKTIIKPMRLSNIIAISAAIISLLSLAANIVLTFFEIK
jgi:hypothetical protein